MSAAQTPTPTPDSNDLVLYRFFDADGQLLYIGKSVNAWSRFTAHRYRSAFYPEATSVELQRGFSTDAELTAAETAAIRREKPRYNITHGNGQRADSLKRRAVPINKREHRNGVVTYEFRFDVGAKSDGSRGTPRIPKDDDRTASGPSGLSGRTTHGQVGRINRSDGSRRPMGQ